MSLALIVCVVMIAVLVGVIAAQGARTFWPQPIDLVATRDGGAFLGVRRGQETYDAPPAEMERLAAMRAAGTLAPDALDSQGRPLRRLYRVGNRDLGQDPFRWVPVHEIASVQRPKAALMVEREAWGLWLGELSAIVLVDDLGPDAPVAEPRQVNTELGPGIASRARARAGQGPETTVERTRIKIADLSTPFGVLHDQARARRRLIEDLTRHELGSINADIERLRLRVREAELRLPGAGGHRELPALPLPAWIAVVLAVPGAIGAAMWLRAGGRGEARRFARLSACCGVLAIPAVAAAVALNPWSSRPITPEVLTAIRAGAAADEARLRAAYAQVDARRLELEREDARFRVEIVEPRSGRFAPRSLSEPGEPMPISSVVRLVPGNDLGVGDKLGIYLARWREFLFDEPRETNTEGGVYPVIFGTVFLTILLTIVVVPLGVIAAIYIREYARQGLVISIIRVAINNLAGVPSIVYGVFGLGFFCYTLGRYIDTGPTDPLPAGGSLGSFWPLVAVLTLIAMAGAALGLIGSPAPGSGRRSRGRTLASASIWAVCAALAIYLIAKSPYFGGFFAEKAPSPTFGTRGILWAALTLALLTLPVVIVATEEAIAAVPRSMREGSHACGATTWQTIRGIVLPGAMPGILTGAILAMARGAGEVAPLMLVGAAKQAPNLPVSSEFPFIHADRSFMHLGFHIYDLGLQSPDSQAARPLVWTTTLLLLVIVLAMNLAAIMLRARLRARSVSAA
jgi:ABC-type phosphate transport system permease subunit/ABC-type phosphate transport system auxiliary subunit